NCFQDTRGAVVRISNFLGKNLDDKTIDTIVNKSSFNNMKENPQAQNDIQHPAFFKQSGSLIRKGKVGDWKTMFTVAQSEMFDKIYMEKMKDLPLNLTGSCEKRRVLNTMVVKAFISLVDDVRKTDPDACCC
ncbi:sulfotransferase 2A1-like, partial [Salvelinus sp. IW2-2015]|uniref:sulfotransferase 2A1-like n=1 Tax=Salvelinus sp. IW2-2015 TaxID=2691554 RepID=UPI000CEAAFA9